MEPHRPGSSIRAEWAGADSGRVVHRRRKLGVWQSATPYGLWNWGHHGKPTHSYGWAFNSGSEQVHPSAVVAKQHAVPLGRDGGAAQVQVFQSAGPRGVGKHLRGHIGER